MKHLGWSLAGMRGRLALGTVLLFAVAALVPGETADAQGQGKYLTEAAARLGKLIGQANKDGYVFYDNQFSVGGGWLKQNSDGWVPLYTVTLQAGKRYRLIAAGDFDAKDVDLDVRDLNGKVYAVDDGVAPGAVVAFSPDTTQSTWSPCFLFDSIEASLHVPRHRPRLEITVTPAAERHAAFSPV